MIDGTGTSTYGFDQLDRLTENKDGHGNAASFEYDLANQQTKVTYPNGKAVTRAYDKAGRLERTTDWLEHTTTFAYDVDSDPTKTTFPTGTGEEDKYVYNDADILTKYETKKGAEVQASVAYTRDSDNQVKTATNKSLPGEEKTTYVYDENNRLTKAGTTEYKYDAANSPTKTGTSTNTYDEASQLKEGTGVTYTYNEVGERTKRTPTSGPATTYAYDQAGNLTAITRPEEGETTKIEDKYAYDGDALRSSETIGATTSYLAWDQTAALPTLLADATSSYIYGPGAMPVEQINNGTGAVQYLHHDQQGSSRVISGATGTVESTYSYDAYGNTAGHTGAATTPLGFDSQYTSSDTGLIYLRARTYDPATSQFLSGDPVTGLTRSPYNYVYDNPANLGDPSGLGLFDEIGEGVAGFGDTITFGGTKLIREGLGNDNVNTCSTGYNAGGITAIAVSFALPGDGEAELAANGAEGATRLLGPGASFGDKVAGQLANRGWTQRLVQSTIDDPASTVATRDIRHLPGGGRMDDPATGYVSRRGGYVVRNDRTGDIVQVSNRAKPGWRAPWDR